MRSVRRLIAFVSGLLLYSTAIGLAYLLIDAWLLRALRPVFGTYNNTLLALSGAVALLIFAISVGWSFLTVRVPAGSRRPTTAWCLAGIGAASLGWVLAGAFGLALRPSERAMSMIDLLLMPSTPPLWGPLNGLAVLAGALLAGVMARRLAPPPRVSKLRTPGGR